MTEAPIIFPPLQNGLIALHGNRTERLADAVMAWLHQHPLAPLEEEVVLVQSNGMAEWVKMEAGARSGVSSRLAGSPSRSWKAGSP